MFMQTRVKTVACGGVSLHTPPAQVMAVDRQSSRDRSMEHDVWRVEPSGDQTMVVHNLRLIVGRCSAFTRFLVLERAARGECSVGGVAIFGHGNERRCTKAGR